MTLCHHTWLPMTAALEECNRCGAQRTPPTTHCVCLRLTRGEMVADRRFTTQEVGDVLRCARCGLPVHIEARPASAYCHQQDGGIVTPNAAAIADRWRELNAEHAARMFADAESRFMAHRAPLPEGSDIIVPDIHGEPTTWTPIASTETESHD